MVSLQPLELIRVMANTVADKSSFYLMSLVGQKMGWVEIEISEVIPMLFWLLLVLSAMRQKDEPQYVRTGQKWWIALVCAACAGVMLQVIAGITSASQADSILMKFSWDGAISWRGIILALVLLVFTRYIKKTKDLHPIVFIGVSAVIGVVFHFAGV